MKTINKVIWCDAGFFPIAYGFCPNEKAWDKEMLRLKETEHSYPFNRRSGSAFTTEFEDKFCATTVLVTLYDNVHKYNDYETIRSIITHEAVHVWQMLRDKIGEDKPSSEFEAYSIQAISKHLWAAVRSCRLTGKP